MILQLIDGEASISPRNLRIRIKKKPLYAGATKYTGCGVCSEVCPVSAVDEYNWTTKEVKNSSKKGLEWSTA